MPFANSKMFYFVFKMGKNCRAHVFLENVNKLSNKKYKKCFGDYLKVSSNDSDEDVSDEEIFLESACETFKKFCRLNYTWFVFWGLHEQ